VELKIGPAHAANEPRAVECRSESTDPHPVRRTSDRRLRRDQHRSPARGWRLALDVSRGVHRRIAACSTSQGLPRGGRTLVRKFVERGFVEATLAPRWGIRRNLGKSEPRPRIGGMLEDADLDGLLRLGGRADPPTHQSGGNTPSPPPPKGSTSRGSFRQGYPW
jgi:hypothetical protein